MRIGIRLSFRVRVVGGGGGSGSSGDGVGRSGGSEEAREGSGPATEENSEILEGDFGGWHKPSAWSFGYSVEVSFVQR